MPLTNINSDWMSNTCSGLCIILVIYITRVLYFASWGVTIDYELGYVRYINCIIITVFTVFNFPYSSLILQQFSMHITTGSCHSLTLVVYVLVVCVGMLLYVCESLKFEGGTDGHGSATVLST